MKTTDFIAVVLAAGKGSRMRSNLPKVMHSLAGAPLIAHVLNALKPLQPKDVVCVIAPHMDSVKVAAVKALPSTKCVIQTEQKGTGHAVLAAEKEIAANKGAHIIVLYGDTPLILPETIHNLIAAIVETDAAVAVLGMELEEPGEYGRLIGKDGELQRIVEYKDATEDEKNIQLCNSGVVAINGKHALDLLKAIKPENAQKEYYLTDIVAIARKKNLECVALIAEAEEVLGVNNREELSNAEALLQSVMRMRAMENGATLIDPETVYFSVDTELGQDVVVQPNVFFGPGVKIGNNVEIRAFSHIEGATVGDNAVVGPFARLRPGANLADNVHIGNFVEIKKSTVEEGAKINHLTYVGDARVGAGANVGAGTITCNYDGVDKYFTDIGAGAFIGSNSSLVAPVKIGDGAVIGAGSVITEDVPADALALERSGQVVKEGRAKKATK